MSAIELINAIESGKTRDMERIFSEMVQTRMEDALETRRVEISQDMFNESLDESAPKGHTIEAYGVKGMKSARWRKTFKNYDHLSDWADKNDAEVHASRDLENYEKHHADRKVEESIDEAIEIKHDRYVRSHGKKANQSGSGHWMFTNKSSGEPSDAEVHQHNGSFKDAAKSAKAWAKKNGHDSVYVMESVEIDEELTLEDFSIEEIQEYMMSEDFEQLDELSKNTLGSYVKNAADSMARAHGDQMKQKADADEVDRFLNRNGQKGDQFANRDKIKDMLGASQKDQSKNFHKVVKRHQGIDKAVGKLTK